MPLTEMYQILEKNVKYIRLCLSDDYKLFEGFEWTLGVWMQKIFLNNLVEISLRISEKYISIERLQLDGYRLTNAQL